MASRCRTQAYALIGLFFLTLLVFTSCQKSNSSHHNLLYLNLGDDPATLDPRLCQIARDLTLTKQLFDGLMRTDSHDKPIPAIATHYQVSADGKVYTFFLRDSLWSDGTKVTAFDFEYAWKKVLNPDFPTDYAHMLFPIKNGRLAKTGKCSLQEVGIKVIDERTLEVTLEEPTPYFLELTAFPTYFPIPKGLDERAPSWSSPPGHHLVSNGPFRIVNWESGSTILLEKNPLYWDKESVFLDGLAFTIINDTTTESYLYEKGELDWLGHPLSQNISTELKNKLKSEGLLSSFPVAGTFWLICNTRMSPFDNVNIRKALSYALSREEIITHILQGKQQVATGLLPPSMALHATAYFKDSDDEKAVALFNQALEEMKISKDSFPTITLSCFSRDPTHKIAQYLQEKWQKTLGIKVEIESTEYKHYRQKVHAGDFQIGVGEWIADFNDPISFLELFKYRGGMNDTGWENPLFVALLDKAQHELNLNRRSEYLEEAEALLINEMVVMPIYHYSFDYVKREKVVDVALTPLGIADFKNARKL